MQNKDSFIPFTKWKPYYKITFIDYEFTIEGNNISFDERVMPEQLGVQGGDKFTVQIDEFGKVSFIKD